MNLRRLAAAVRALAPVVNLVAETLEAEAPAHDGPHLITQHNVEEVLGMPSRTFLELLRRPGFPLPVMRLGALRGVEHAKLLNWLLSGGAASLGLPANETRPIAAPTAADILDELGLEPDPRRRQRSRS
jgi:hypothetical protein